MKKRPTYRELVNAARDYIAKDLETNPEDWEESSHFDYLAGKAMNLVPEDADFEWAVSIFRQSKTVREQTEGDGLAIFDHMIGSIRASISSEMYDIFLETVERLDKTDVMTP